MGNYKDSLSDQELLSVCLPSFANDGTPIKKFLGVSCLDFSVLIDNNKLKAKDDYHSFETNYREMAAECLKRKPSAAQLAQLRQHEPLQFTELYNFADEYTCDNWVDSSAFGTAPGAFAMALALIGVFFA